MKNKKIKIFLGAMLALSMAFSVGTFAKSKPIESVSASALVCGEPEEDPASSSEDPNDPASSTPSTPQSSETSESSESAEPAAEGEPKGESSSEAPQVPTFKEIIEIVKNMFIDAWNDLVAHVKRWLKIG